MAAFDFIADKEFRLNLESDMAELQACMDSGSFKAVHVLAGSVIEAVLIDYLVDANFKHPNAKKKDILRLDLADAIEASQALGALSARSADLCSVVRDYRNLIHAGRAVRTGEKVDKQTASVAANLVDIVLREVAELRERKFGYTAEQLLTKIERDRFATSILTDLLKQTRDDEVERLILSVLPSRYAELDRHDQGSGMYGEGLAQLARGYRAALDATAESVRQGAAREFVRVLREEGEPEIRMYKTALFRGADLVHLEDAEREVAKSHLLEEFDRQPSAGVMAGLSGIGEFIGPSESVRLVNAAMKYVQQDPAPGHRKQIGEFVNSLWYDASAPQDAAIQNSVNAWVDAFQTAQRYTLANWAGQLAGVARVVRDPANEMDVDDIPF